MNAKGRIDKPDVRYLGDALDGAGLTAHVVLPITDPYVVHHASLGSAAWIHVEDDDIERAQQIVAALDGVEEVLGREEAARELEVPEDRIGELVVLADASTALGGHEREHDLSKLHGALRTHGGRHERRVPVVLSERVAVPPGLRNRDVHELLIGAR